MLNDGKLLVDASGTGSVGDMQKAVAKYGNKVYGAYANILTSEGVSAMFNGVIGSSNDVKKDSLSVSVDGKAVVAVEPDNLISFPSEIVLVGGSGGDSKETLINITDESKSDLIDQLVSKVKITTAKSF